MANRETRETFPGTKPQLVAQVGRLTAELHDLGLTLVLQSAIHARETDATCQRSDVLAESVKRAISLIRSCRRQEWTPACDAELLELENLCMEQDAAAKRLRDLIAARRAAAVSHG